MRPDSINEFRKIIERSYKHHPIVMKRPLKELTSHIPFYHGPTRRGAQMGYLTYLPHLRLIGLGLERLCFFTGTLFGPGFPALSGLHLIAKAYHLLPGASCRLPQSAIHQEARVSLGTSPCWFYAVSSLYSRESEPISFRIVSRNRKGFSRLLNRHSNSLR